MMSPGARLRCLVVVGVAFVLLASACGGSGYHYVESRSNGAYFKVPENWKLYGRDDLAGPAPTTAEANAALRFVTAFDADPEPSVKHFVNSPHPFGFARVRTISVEDRDTFSLATIRNELLDFDKTIAADPTKITVATRAKLITLPKGTRGTRIVYTVHEDDGQSFTVDQIGLTDPATSKFYFFAIGCEASCYEANRRTITEIADSWTIKEP